MLAALEATDACLCNSRKLGDFLLAEFQGLADLTKLPPAIFSIGSTMLIASAAALRT